MKRAKVSSAIIGFLGFAALVLVASTPAKAAFVVGGENGWQLSYDGMINVFMVYDAKDQLQYKDGSIKTASPNSEMQSFRIRTGLLPSIFAFNVKSPTIDGVDYAARIGLYPQIQNNGTRIGLGTYGSGGTSIDIREVFFTADGKFGQFLIGRALNLFEGKNILTDMTLIGNGVPLNMTGGGVDLGHIGYGYTYTSFGPQFRYTTPDISGLKVAFAICDPSAIGSVTDASGTETISANKINQPRFETEISYAKTIGSTKISAWLAGMYQEAKFDGSSVVDPGYLEGHKVSTIAGAGGVQAWVGPVELLLSGFGGQAVGVQLTQVDSAVLDIAGKERISYGGLAHATYTIGKAKLGVQYGINYVDRTEVDKDLNSDVIKSKQAVTGGCYYSVNKFLTLVGEYTWARDSYYDNSRQTQNIVSLGTVFVW
ncbi:MAG: porin [Geobacteraceae bacterium]|nr:porin [Geobacteraceae bacterium]